MAMRTQHQQADQARYLADIQSVVMSFLKDSMTEQDRMKADLIKAIYQSHDQTHIDKHCDGGVHRMQHVLSNIDVENISQQLMTSLRFYNMEYRHDAIHEAHKKTF